MSAGKYEIKTTVRASLSWDPKWVTIIEMSRNRVAVTMPAFENYDHEYAALRLKIALNGIKRARREYRRTYGKRAP